MATKGQKLLAAGATLAVAEPALAALHGGPVGVIVGGALGLATYMYADDLAKLVGKDIPSLPAKKEREPGKPGMLYRLLNGRSTRGDGQDEPGEQESYDEQGYEDEIDDMCLDLAPDLRPHINSVLSHRFTVLGKPGSGKTNAVTDLLEELGRFDAPLVVFDHKPEYRSLLDCFSNPFEANASTVTPKTAYDFGIRLMNERLQVILDLRSYRNDTAAAVVMIQIVAAIYAWQARLSIEDRVPCTIVLDEAHYWLPQSEQHSTVSRAKGKDGQPSVFASLQQAFFNLVSGGRSMGMGCILATQRPATIDNRAIAH